MTKIFTVILCFLVNQNILASEPKNWQILFQTPASPLMEELHRFHNFLLWIIIAIVLFVAALLCYVCRRFSAKRNPTPAAFSHNVLIEVMWTIVPVIILIVIAVPSFRILAMMEKIPPSEITVKVVGYQWYWHYIYPDNGNIEFDSYVISKENLKPGQRRLLEVDNRLVIPENTVVKFLITGGDVLHSFAVPSLGIKMDAVPGKINETWTKIAKKGVYYGQCSELCGVHHGFMPIAIEVVSKEEFANWLTSAKLKFAMRPLLYANKEISNLTITN
ncbi:MAG: cytochrome c oxidase subunit II [Janthinobacterium lividum]